MGARGWLVVLVTLGPSSPAVAQRPEADAAFQRGRALMARGEVARACREFETSMSLDPLKGTLYNLAQCHEQLGKIATAWTEFTEVADTDTNAARAEDSARRARALAPRLTRMRLVITERADGLVVMRDKLDVTGLADREVPVDPGRYTFVATAPGHDPVRVEADLTRRGETIDVVIPRFGAPDQPSTPTGDADPYATALTRRPLALPRGVLEATVQVALADSASYPSDPIDGAVGVRRGFGPIEGRLSTGFHLRYAQPSGSRPNAITHIAAGASYLISPRFTAALDYVYVQPSGGPVTGSDLRTELARRLPLAPAVSIEGHGGLLYSERNSATELALAGLGRVQLALSPVSFQADASMTVNVSGSLYDHTFGLVFGATALWAIDRRDDVFASATFDVFPTEWDGKRFVLGVTRRIP